MNNIIAGRELPIPFKAQMVHEIIMGRKTHTRRPAKPPAEFATDNSGIKIYQRNKAGTWIGYYTEAEFINQKSRYQAGDRLWVKENYWEWGHWDILPDAHDIPENCFNNGGKEWMASDKPIVFCAGATEDALKLNDPPANDGNFWRKKSGMFMPKAIARLWLLVESVRAVELQAITDEEAIAEGFFKVSFDNGKQWLSPRYHFFHYWDAMYKGTPFASANNPIVFDYQFRKINRHC